MNIFNDISALRETLDLYRKKGERIGFVPTMGNLHAGHLHLVETAKQQCDRVVVSIFVNPLQFGENEDFSTYPRTMQADCAALQSSGVDEIFAPDIKAMYPKGIEQQATVQVPGVSEEHCGASRPGHFVGVATVVTKLFNAVEPDKAFFGKKDFQQLAVIRQMAESLCMRVQIVGVDTVREESGLAMSSRNGYLTEEQKQQASLLYKTLNALKQDMTSNGLGTGGDFAEALERKRSDAIEVLKNSDFVVDYLNICNSSTLQPLSSGEHDVVILVAVKLGSTRLIDNIDFQMLA